MKNTVILAIIAAAIVFGLVGFVAGRRVALRNFPVNQSFRMGMMNRRLNPFSTGGMAGYQWTGGFGTMGVGGIVGQIANVSGNTITVQAANGQTRSITLNTNTVINKRITGSLTDLKNGQQVIVTGNGAFQTQTVWITQ
jgi:hypothetical protein